MNLNDGLETQNDAIAELCGKYIVEKRFAFDSAIRDDYRTAVSDVDLLGEFAPIGGHAEIHAIVLGLNRQQMIPLREPKPASTAPHDKIQRLRRA